MRQKTRPRKVLATRTGRRMIYVLALLVGMLCSCSATQKISVKQSQGDQQQETTIEHGSSIKELSLHFNNCPSPQVNYPQVLTTSKTPYYASSKK